MNHVVLVLPLLWAGGLAQNAATPICNGPNEVATDCYSPCDTTCYTRFRSDGRVCTQQCQPGCTCAPGSLRHDNGTCVDIFYCSPPLCNNDETFNACGTCEQRCASIGDNCTSCIPACIAGCYCNQGTIRGPDDVTCVRPSQCPAPTCGANEIYSTCPSTCLTGRCQDIWTRKKCSRSSQCCRPRCICRDGYNKNNNNVCITTAECIRTRGN